MHAVELSLIGARANPKLESAIAINVEQGGFAGDVNGVPVGRDDNAGA